MRSKTENLLIIGIYSFLFSYFAKLFDMDNLLCVAGAAIASVLLMVKQRKIRVDVQTCLLALAIALYFITDMGILKTFTSHSFYEVVVLFVLGHYLSCEIKRNKNNDKLLLTVLLVMILGLTIHGILNSYTFLDGQFKDDNFRIWKDFWSGEYINATIQVLYYFPSFAMMFPAIVFFKNRCIINLIILSSAVFFIYITLVSQSRMPIIMLPVCLGFQFILYIFECKGSFKEYFTKKRLILLGGIIMIGIITISGVFLFTSVGKDFLGIMGRSGGIFNNVRFEIQRSALKQIFVYPFGGNQMEHLGYAHTHNLWLDIADVGGIIPFVIFVIFTCITIYEVVILIKNKTISSEIKLSVLGLYVLYFLFFTIEPGLNWHVYFITPWIFLNGLVHGCVHK